MRPRRSSKLASRFFAYSTAVMPSMPGAPSLRVSRQASFIHSKSMTWCSVESATPRLSLASAAIRCRFVDRFAKLKVFSRVSRQRLSSRGASLPSVGSRRVQFPVCGRYYEGATTSRSRNLGRLLVRFRAPRDPSGVRARRMALPDRWRTGPGPGTCSAGCPKCRLALTWT